MDAKKELKKYLQDEISTIRHDLGDKFQNEYILLWIKKNAEIFSEHWEASKCRFCLKGCVWKCREKIIKECDGFV